MTNKTANAAKSGTASYETWLKESATDTAVTVAQSAKDNASDAAQATTSAANSLKDKVLDFLNTDEE